MTRQIKFGQTVILLISVVYYIIVMPTNSRKEGVISAIRRRVNASPDLISSLALLAVLIVGYNLVYRFLQPLAFLSESAYRNNSITVSALQDPQFLGVLLLSSALLAVGSQELSWNELKHGHALRWLILLAALPFLWTFVTYEYNYFIDQPHHFDRVLLIALYGLVWVHPAFIFPFLLLLHAIMGQFVPPFGTFSQTDKRLPLTFLMLFASYLFLRLRHHMVFQRTIGQTRLGFLVNRSVHDERVFVWAAAGLIGGSYFVPALSKTGLLWPFRESLYYYIPLKYSWGWLGHLDQMLIMEGFRILKLLNPIAVWAPMLIQGAAIALMWRKRWLKLIISGFVIFHLLVFAVSGLLFWKWIVLDVAFAGFVVYTDSETVGTAFSTRTAVVVTILILLSPFLFQTTWLGWYTMNYDRQYSVEAVSTDGEVHHVHWSKMDPYRLTFATNRFGFIHNKRLIDRFTTRDYELVVDLRNANDTDDVDEITAQHGTVRHDPQRAEEFDRFLQEYFESVQRHPDNGIFWSDIPSPPHGWSTVETEPLPRNKEYKTIRIRETERLVTDGEIKIVGSKIVRNISLEQGGG